MFKPPRSAYIHIPFCHRRCFYCDFSVVPLGDKVESIRGVGSRTINEYLDFLKKEILSIKHKSPLSTIYIGGGTPSILDPFQIKDLIDVFNSNYGIEDGAEITMEIDPASFEEKDLHGFIQAGVNRFSLGAQSFNDDLLKKAGRRHNLVDLENSCFWLQKAKSHMLIRSWSLDLIQNLPESNLDFWEIDLKKALKFKPPHISIYDLNIEDGTVFKRLLDMGKLNLPDHEESFKNSQLTNSIFKSHGYSRYEISNYSIPGHQSRHNRVYWKGLGWWSFGQGSTSSPWGVKFTRPRVSRAYKEWVLKQCEVCLEPSLNNKKEPYLDLDEKLMLGLRVKEGVNIKRLFLEQGWDERQTESNLCKLLEVWANFRESGILCNEGDRFFLSDPMGMDLSNQVLISMFSWWENIN